MHSVLVADLAALVSQHGQAIVQGREHVPSQAITSYWAASRNRLELWHQTLARYQKAEATGQPTELSRWWSEHLVVLEEVFVTEMLTRVVASLAADLDERHETDEIAPVTHAVFLSHLEARNRVQQIMLFGRGLSVSESVRLNRLRLGVERWIDVLIGRLSSQAPKLVRYAMDPQRATQYAKEHRMMESGSAKRTATWLMNASMHDMLRQRASAKVALGQANRAVANSVVMLLRPDLFDSVGVLKSLWMHRLQSGTQKAERVLDELKHQDIDQADLGNGLDTISGNHLGRWYC